MFRDEWQILDPMSTGKLTSEQLVVLLQVLPAPIGLGGENSSLSTSERQSFIVKTMSEMAVPIRNGSISFREAAYHMARHLLVRTCARARARGRSDAWHDAIDLIG